MKKSVNKNKKTRLFTKRNAVIAMVVLLMAAPFVVYGYNKWLDSKDYNRFMLVKGTVEKVAERLSSDLPDIEWETEATCRRGHLPFGEGEASCDVLTHGDIIVHEGTSAQQLSDSFYSSLLDNTDYIKERRKGDEAPNNFLADLKEGYTGGGFVDNQTNISCGYIQRLERRETLTLRLTFSCGDNSRDTWFPRSDI